MSNNCYLNSINFYSILETAKIMNSNNIVIPRLIDFKHDHTTLLGYENGIYSKIIISNNNELIVSWDNTILPYITLQSNQIKAMLSDYKKFDESTILLEYDTFNTDFNPLSIGRNIKLNESFYPLQNIDISNIISFILDYDSNPAGTIIDLNNDSQFNDFRNQKVSYGTYTYLYQNHILLLPRSVLSINKNDSIFLTIKNTKFSNKFIFGFKIIRNAKINNTKITTEINYYGMCMDFI